MVSTVRHNSRQTRRRSSHGSARRDRSQQSESRQPQLVLIACSQRIIDAMDSAEAKPTEVKIDGESYFNAYPVTREEALEWCQRCKRALCRCKNKFEAPFILAWKVRRKGKRVVPLRRQELPISIPRRRAA